MPLILNIRAYITLCKPRVVMLMILTSLIGMKLASKHAPLSWHVLMLGNAGIALMACGAAAVNHLLDQVHDARMQRTAQRPLPAQVLTSRQAGLFAFVMTLAGGVLLTETVNGLTAVLTLLTFIGYAFIYTAYLKHATSQNIVIGGLSGAMPPLLGWTSVTGHLAPEPWLLVLIIFLWTPPHFWALALYRFEDYARVPIPMLPHTHGKVYTKLQIVFYTVLLFAASFFPVCFQMAGGFYAGAAFFLNSYFLYLAIQLYRDKKDSRPTLALQLFRFSILYLGLLFLALLL